MKVLLQLCVRDKCSAEECLLCSFVSAEYEQESLFSVGSVRIKDAMPVFQAENRNDDSSVLGRK